MREASVFGVALCVLLCSCRFESVVHLRSALDADSYAFYSSLYKASSWLEAGEVLGIATEPLELADKPYCFKPSTAEERGIVAKVGSPKTHTFSWEAKFDFGRPYALIPQNEVTTAIDCVGQKYGQRALSGCERYEKLRFVRFLSIPIFNKDHTRALAGISRSCGGLCGEGNIRMYRKDGQAWKVEKDSFVTCSWEA